MGRDKGNREVRNHRKNRKKSPASDRPRGKDRDEKIRQILNFYQMGSLDVQGQGAHTIGVRGTQR